MNRSYIKIILFPLLLLILNGFSQTPTITARFANPEYNAGTQTYYLDVEFQSDMPDKQLYGMNVRFFYDEDVLEFEQFDEFAEGYGPITPNPPIINTLSATSGPVLFGFTGPAEFVNGAIQLVSTSSVYLSTTDWTKLFSVSFHVDDTAAMIGDFCPSVVWDLEEDPVNGGFFTGSAGVFITVVVPPSQSEPANRNVIQFNWNYDSEPGYPYGYPADQSCVSTRTAPTTRIRSSFCNGHDYITFPVMVWDFVDINSFSLTLDYDTTVLEYCCAIPHPAIAENFETSTAVPGRVQMTSDGFDTSLVDESVFFYATFKYLGGACGLSWHDTGSTCEYIDAVTNMPLYDIPVTNYYFEGSVDSGQHIWIGDSSSNWSEADNWEGNFVPGRFDNVSISATPPPTYWPHFMGGFTLGDQCRNLTLQGSSELTIDGDLVIHPGHTLTIADSGEVLIGGDWMNSGNFNPGYGSVTFIGNVDGSIGTGPPPEYFIEGFNVSTFDLGMQALYTSTPGPTGDNSHMDVPIGFTFNYLGNDYSQIRINTNGWLSFDMNCPDSLSPDNINLFTSQVPILTLAPWWDDLLADANSSISYKTRSTEPNRIFIVEWENLLSYSSGATARVNFQVFLRETTNVIEFKYGNVSAGMHNANESASIGIKNDSGGPGNFLEPLNSTSNIMVTCLNSSTNWPTTNFRFTPPSQNSTEIFHHIAISKETGELRISQNVIITGTD